VSTAVVNYLVPAKLAFLNFYFLPIILAGYYLRRRSAVLGALLCALMMSIYVVLFPEAFAASGRRGDVYTYIAAWAGFLILAGAVVGRLQEKLAEEVHTTAALNAELRHRQQDLTAANRTLKDYGDNLEARVRDRTEELEASKAAVEAMKTKVEDTLYATMDASVANLIIEGRLRTEKRNVAVMFSDLSGFTTDSEDRQPRADGRLRLSRAAEGGGHPVRGPHRRRRRRLRRADVLASVPGPAGPRRRARRDRPQLRARRLRLAGRRDAPQAPRLTTCRRSPRANASTVAMEMRSMFDAASRVL